MLLQKEKEKKEIVNYCVLKRVIKEVNLALQKGSHRNSRPLPFNVEIDEITTSYLNLIFAT